jgi:hypothetical protein
LTAKEVVVRSIVWFFAACALVLISSPAFAQPPNDTYAGRGVLGLDDLPFEEVVDTTSATTDADDDAVNAACGAPATDASVWYELTATADAPIVVDVSNADYSAGIIVAAVESGRFSTITCAPSVLDFQAIAGQTYAILAFDDQGDSQGNGGLLHIRISALAEPVILSRIRVLPGVASATFVRSPIPGTSLFQILFEQPVDHNQAGGPTFLQRLTLLHRSETAPTVLLINGYNIASVPRQHELTAFFAANQIEVEHRFFTPSSPDPQTWEDLTIAQSAADHHRILESFKNLYSGKWVSTGHSKGGMAAVYHRHFYPTDVDATVPYGAPSSHGLRDARYVPFIDRIGTAACRQRLVDFQRNALAHRSELVALLPDGAFSILGVDRALEFAIVETPFAFWQFGRFNSCASIPGSGASATELMDFLDQVTFVLSYADDTLLFYAPYYYQAATELGGPRYDERNLNRWLNYPREDIPPVYPPIGVEKDFNRSTMQQVEQWVNTSATRMLFIYGANDPWSASAFDVKSKNDSYRIYVTGTSGDHLASIFELPETDFMFALDKLSQWLQQSDSAAVRQRAKATPKDKIRPTRHDVFMR